MDRTVCLLAKSEMGGQCSIKTVKQVKTKKMPNLFIFAKIQNSTNELKSYFSIQYLFRAVSGSAAQQCADTPELRPIARPVNCSNCVSEGERDVGRDAGN